MTQYAITFDRTQRMLTYVEADSPESAIEQFWLDENEGIDNSIEVDSSGPTNLAMSDRRGNPVVWGDRTTL